MIFKNKVRLLVLLLISWLSISFGGLQELEAQQALKIEAEDVYTYPVRPGTKAWKRTKKYTKRLEACEVPTRILKRMSTKGLLKTVIGHPYWDEMFSFFPRKDGYEVMKSKNDALAELVERKDAARILTDLYLSHDAGDFGENWDGIMCVNYSYQINLLEHIILDKNVFKQLTAEDKEKLAKSCLEKVLVMQALTKIYDILSIFETASFGSYLLSSLEYAPCKELRETEYYWMDFLERKFPPNGTELITKAVELLTEFANTQ